MTPIDGALDSLQGAEYFSSLDMRSGYWQMSMHEDDNEKKKQRLQPQMDFTNSTPGLSGYAMHL